LLEAYRAATGGDAWLHVRGITLQGRVEAGGSPGTFTEVIDHQNGFTKRSIQTGPLQDLSGYDGAPWVAQNGIVTQIDLPALIADANTRAFERRDGWWDRPPATTVAMAATPPSSGAGADVITLVPNGGSPVDIWLDPATHLIMRTVEHQDGGDVTTLYADWRDIEGVRIPFRRDETDASGGHTLYQIMSAQIQAQAPNRASLHRPVAEPHGTMTEGAATINFRFTATDHGHIVAPATVDGHHADLIFDTGAANYFTPEAASRLGLITAGGVNLAGVSGGGVNGGFAKVSQISIGAADLKNEAVIVGPLPFVAKHPRAGMDIDGLTGFEFLAAFRTTIDYAAKTIRFAQLGGPPEQQGVTIPFLSDEHDVYVEAQIEGTKGLFRVDTGDGGGVTVFKPFADRHGLFATGGRTNIDAGGLGGTLHTKEFNEGHLILAGTSFDSVPVKLAEANAGSFASKSLAGNLGAALLGRFRITFDYQARTLTFQPAANARQPFPTSNAGLSVTQSRPDRLEVLAVQPGSPAFRANIRPGDAIVQINAASVAREKLGVFDLLPLLSGSRAINMTIDRNGILTGATISPEPSLAH
jgi:hypothetical protein